MDTPRIGILGFGEVGRRFAADLRAGSASRSIATFDLPPKAELARNALTAAGIQSVLGDDNLIGMDWLVGNAVGLTSSSDESSMPHCSEQYGQCVAVAAGMARTLGSAGDFALRRIN